MEAGDFVGERYRIVSLVGEGGMGRVWRSHDTFLDRDVAVKQILLPYGVAPAERNLLIQRVLREARAAARLNHPGIITVHDVIQHDDTPLIVMEYVRGRSLEAVIAEQGRLPPENVAPIGEAMLDALTEAHLAGVIHRDLKPDNVLLTGRRTIIGDFGIASLIDATNLTSPGTVLGTPLYMAPEQIEGHAATAASDLWSLGATLYAAVEGHPPFAGRTLTALYRAVLTEPPRPVRHAGRLAPLLTGLLLKDPNQRLAAEQASAILRQIFQPNAQPFRGPGISDTKPMTNSPSGLLKNRSISPRRILHPSRVAWEGAHAIVEATGTPVYWWLSASIADYLGIEYRQKVAETRERLQRTDSPYSEMGMWRVHLEALLREHPSAVQPLFDLLTEIKRRLVGGS